MNTQSKVNAKPSAAHNDESILKAKAQAANQKRDARKAQRAREEQEARWEAENKAADEAKARRQAQEDARREADKKLREEAEARAQEEAMWNEFKPQDKPKKERAKSTKSGSSGTKIKTMVDGIEFDSLAKAMAFIDPKQWGKESDYRTSHWIRINRALKRDGKVVYMGHTYEKI